MVHAPRYLGAPAAPACLALSLAHLPCPSSARVPAVHGRKRALHPPLLRVHNQHMPLRSDVLCAQWSMFKNQVKGFVQAIEWTEPWLIGLACFHLVLLVAAVCCPASAL